MKPFISWEELSEFTDTVDGSYCFISGFMEIRFINDIILKTIYLIDDTWKKDDSELTLWPGIVYKSETVQ